MTVGKADEDALRAKFAVMRPFLDERAWRVYLGTEAGALGYGGGAAVHLESAAGVTRISVLESFETVRAARGR